MKLEKNKLLQRYAELSPRDRLLSVAGIVMVLLYGGYLFFYQPLEAENQRLEQKIQSQRQAYQHLQQIGREVAALRRQGIVSTAAPDRAGQSLMAVIDSSSQQLDVKPAIKRMLPEGADKVTVWLENVSFDKLIYWLAILQSKHQLPVVQIDVDRQAGGEGLVNAKVLLGG